MNPPDTGYPMHSGTRHTQTIIADLAGCVFIDLCTTHTHYQLGSGWGHWRGLKEGRWERLKEGMGRGDVMQSYLN